MQWRAWLLERAAGVFEGGDASVEPAVEVKLFTPKLVSHVGE